MKKLILVLIVLLAIGGAVAAYYMNKGTPEPTVSTLQITRGDIVDTVGATGTLEAVETVDVGTQVSGVVEALYADFNDIVKKGQIIARLDPSLIQTAIEQREASVTRARADLDRLKVSLQDAERKLEQAKSLWAKQLIPRDQLDTADLNVKQLQSQIKSSEAGLSQALADLNTQKVNLGHTVIKSPIDGIVISRSVDQGQTVAASMNAPVLYVLAADLTKMQVLANIDESEIGKLRAGQPVNFRVDAYPSDTFHGTVAQVRLLPTTVQNVVTYSTVIDVPNPDYKLKPGMTANVNIEIARRNNVLRVPNAALRFRPTNDIFAALKQEVPPDMQRAGRGGPGAPGGQSGGGASAPAPQRAPGGGGATSVPAQGQAADGNANRGGRRDPSAQGGGDSTGSPRGDSRGGRGFSNLTPEQREARRKQMEERMKTMSPEERAQWEQRTQRRGQGDSTGSPQRQRGEGGNRAQGVDPNRRYQPDQSGEGSTISRTTATTIDALFAPPPVVESRGRVWLYVNKQLKSVPILYGITDGTWTELIESSDTAPLDPGTELVTNVVTGMEPANRPGGQGQGSPLMPQRGGGRGPGGGGRGRYWRRSFKSAISSRRTTSATTSCARFAARIWTCSRGNSSRSRGRRARASRR